MVTHTEIEHLKSKLTERESERDGDRLKKRIDSEAVRGRDEFERNGRRGWSETESRRGKKRQKEKIEQGEVDIMRETHMHGERGRERARDKGLAGECTDRER